MEYVCLALSRRASCFFAKKQLAEAQADLEKLLSLNPDYPGASVSPTPGDKEGIRIDSSVRVVLLEYVLRYFFSSTSEQRASIEDT